VLEGLAMKAYVFINISPGKSPEVVRDLRKVDGVKSADLCWGLPDVIAMVEAGDLKTLRDVVLNKIQKIGGVSQTDTHIFLES
jgi:DNA-binding Lrp family transcriptional regulator